MGEDSSILGTWNPPRYFRDIDPRDGEVWGAAATKSWESKGAQGAPLKK